MLSGVVITYNREDVLELCLRSIRFVDELIVVDKSSTDLSGQIAMRYADRYVVTPWTPTVEETRAEAIKSCSHDFIVLLDDDECLNLAATQFIKKESLDPKFDIYRIPIRHHALGRHDERSYNWPEYRSVFFRRGAIEFTSTVHSGVHLKSSARYDVPLDAGACIHHLTSPDVSSYVEKTNRYTDRADRRRLIPDSELVPVGAFARRALDSWLSRVTIPDEHLEAVTALRGVYDIIDGLKRWETLHSTGEPFAEAKQALAAEFPASPSPAPEKTYTSDWFSHNIPAWTRMLKAAGLGAEKPLVAIELGAFEGRATNWMLDHLLAHPESILHCVDTFPDRDAPDSYWRRFHNNVLKREDAAKARVHIGPTFRFLNDFVHRREKADFIYVDASHRACDVLSDLILAFRAAKVGGVIICDDYLGGAGPNQELTLGSPKIAIDAFTTIFRPALQIISGQPLYQLAFIKKSELSEDDPASRGMAC